MSFSSQDIRPAFRVYGTHGCSRNIIRPCKYVLNFGSFLL
jgi:hypothetical protein